MEKDVSQTSPAITDAPAPTAFEAHAKKPGHFVTKGEKKFDFMTYTSVGYIINALMSVGAVYWVERTHSGQKMMDRFIEGTKQNLPSVNPDTAKLLATKSFFLSGGFAVLAPMKWLEDAKVNLVKKWDRKIYGDAVDTDPTLIQSHKDLEAAPKQGWGSIFASRALALVPFYLTVGALWERKSLLSKATNPELSALGKEGRKALEESDPAKFSQIAGKGAYFDRPIGYVSRKIGKGWAKRTGNAETVAQIEKMEAKYPGTIRSAKTATGDHDPNHSAVPYYFISEAITSGMVAWGVFALTRVLGPVMGKKHPAPKKQDERPAEIHTNAYSEVPLVPQEKSQDSPETKINLAQVERQPALPQLQHVAR